MTPARQPHPQRCETCNHLHEDLFCDFQYNDDGDPIGFLSVAEHILIALVGCASHSSTPAPAPDEEDIGFGGSIIDEAYRIAIMAADDNGYLDLEKIANSFLKLRSRPHTPAPLRCWTGCACRTPECEEHCAERLSEKEHDAQVAKSERERARKEVANEIWDASHRIYEGSLRLDFGAMERKLQSLRARQQWQCNGGTHKPPDMRPFLNCYRIIRYLNPRYWVIENVRGSIPYFRLVLGDPVKRVGSRILWGDFPIFDTSPKYGKWKLSPTEDRAEIRSEIPAGLSKALCQGIMMAASGLAGIGR